MKGRHTRRGQLVPARDLRKWFYTLQFTLNNNLLKDIAEMQIARLGYGD